MELLKGLRSMILTCVFIYVAFIALLFFMQRDFIYFPSPIFPNKVATGTADLVEDIAVQTADGLTLKAWFIPPKDNKPILLFFHGNGGSVLSSLQKSTRYADQGYGALLAEYRGYSGNEGAPTEQGLYADGRAYYDWLIARGYTVDDVIVYGESLGSGVATQIALERDVRGVIYEAPYARLSDPAQRQFFFIPFLDFLVKDKFASVDKIGKIDVPMLFMIAGKDRVVGRETGIALHNAARGASKKLVVFEEAGHNTLYQYGAADTALEFMASLPAR